ncbi:MAG: XRE family transcriptional regulator [Tistlia sp.]|uniref:helix-turn-helix domain-containing protein n=1 Tax=Tistlia sp. TaxID=3057121 RepID=UPI0034A3ACB1
MTSTLPSPQPPTQAAEQPALTRVRQKFVAEGGEGSDGWVGRQVRDLRKARGMSLKQLNEASGLSIGLLSQIERGTSSPSLRSLRALSEALGVPPIWFFNDGRMPPPRERDVIVRGGAGRRLELPHKRIVKELVTPDLSGTLQMLIVVIEPGGTTGSENYSHPGEECGYLLEGELDLWVGGDHFQLRKGDSFRFKSTLPHQSFNPGKVTTRIIWVTSPPFY